jgi:hypothetical protein
VLHLDYKHRATATSPVAAAIGAAAPHMGEYISVVDGIAANNRDMFTTPGRNPRS